MDRLTPEREEHFRWLGKIFVDGAVIGGVARELLAEIDALRAERDALLEDKRRLDWLEDKVARRDAADLISLAIFRSLRETIDTASARGFAVAVSMEHRAEGRSDEALDTARKEIPRC